MINDIYLDDDINIRNRLYIWLISLKNISERSMKRGLFLSGNSKAIGKLKILSNLEIQSRSQ